MSPALSFSPGDVVRVAYGALCGEKGVVVAAGDAWQRVSVAIELFGCDTLARLDSTMLEHLRLEPRKSRS